MHVTIFWNTQNSLRHCQIPYDNVAVVWVFIWRVRDILQGYLIWPPTEEAFLACTGIYTFVFLLRMQIFHQAAYRSLILDVTALKSTPSFVCSSTQMCSLVDVLEVSYRNRRVSTPNVCCRSDVSNCKPACRIWPFRIFERPAKLFKINRLWGLNIKIFNYLQSIRWDRKICYQIS